MKTYIESMFYLLEHLRAKGEDALTTEECNLFVICTELEKNVGSFVDLYKQYVAEYGKTSLLVDEDGLKREIQGHNVDLTQSLAFGAALQEVGVFGPIQPPTSELTDSDLESEQFSEFESMMFGVEFDY
jgi:hypothetical protein